jgi:hypothetical protein
LQVTEATLIRFEELFGLFGTLAFLLGRLLRRWQHCAIGSEPA